MELKRGKKEGIWGGGGEGVVPNVLQQLTMRKDIQPRFDIPSNGARRDDASAFTHVGGKPLLKGCSLSQLVPLNRLCPGIFCREHPGISL